MAYNLRSQPMSEELLEEDENREEFEQNDDKHFPSEEESSAYTSGSNDDVEMEDVSLNVRLQISRFRGRPSTKLRGKNGFLWNTTFSSRRSGS